MAIFRPSEGERFEKVFVVDNCRIYIRSRAFGGNVVEKEQKISLIERKNGAVLEFRSRGGGWGNSPMNPNCWVPVAPASGQDRDGHPADPPVMSEPTDDLVLAGSGYRSQYNRRPWGGKYRNDVMVLWGGRCAVTGCSTASLLTASHIKPVIHCTPDEMVDPHNGILLSKLYDKLFDSGLVSFLDSGEMVISPHVPERDLASLGIDKATKIEVGAEQRRYLEFHRSKILRG
jgi:hypothetical protein